ncbi:MAG: hypothetical protein DRI98_13650 [Bacteroidetes bacterium]|nr:MAG: hypothetical protein DRI98_13650 [Bacteroidota bacterium]
MALEILKDYADEKLIFKSSEDVGSVIDANKAEFNQGIDLSFGRKYASVPTIVLDAWIREGVDYRKIGKDPEMAKKFRAKLADPEWRAFRTHSGNL